jgi:uncharacterized protein (DUF1800 family)
MPTVSRRALLRIPDPLQALTPPAPVNAPSAPSRPALVLSGDLTPYTGPWTAAHAAHLLRRTTFGVKKAQLDALVALGSANAAVDHVLNVPAGLPAPPVNNYNNPDYTDPIVPAGETWVDAYFELGAEPYRIESWRGWWFDRMIEGPANIEEKLVLFWHNHFATQTEIVLSGAAAYRHNQLLRQHALGDFKAFVKAVTLDAMMLRYLNGYLNHKNAPDENYARELQELFTVGKDTADQYTEADVVAAARVLTGWRINLLPTPQFLDTYFDYTAHDTGAKQFSAYYNNTVIAGSLNGEAELDALLDMIFAKEHVSKFICRKLYRYFVYYEIDAAIEANIIAPLAQIFRDNGYAIQSVLEALFKSEHFFEAYATGCFIKTPMDIYIGTLRSFNLSLPASTPFDEFVQRYIISYWGREMSMLPGDPPSVAGWPAFRQPPGYYRFWISGDTMRNRNVLTDIFAFVGIESPNDKLQIDHVAFAAQFGNPGDPNALVDDVVRLLLPVDLSPVKKTALKGILLSGQASDAYWTSAWTDYVNDPANQMAYDTVWLRLALLHKYIMNLPEFQLS